MPIVIGLTGGIGAGKSTIARQFAELGVGVVDADFISRSLTAPNGLAIPRIAEVFGAEFIGADGALDRHKMRETVFKDVLQKQRLEAILHPLIRLELDRQITEAAKASAVNYIVAEIPLLFAATDYFMRYRRIALVDCSIATQVERVQMRSKLSLEAVISIITAQTPRQLRLQLSRDVISNNSESSVARVQVLNLHEKYLKLK